MKDLIAHLEASGLHPVIIDENTVFPPQSQFLPGTNIQFACEEVNKRYMEWLIRKAIPNGECLDCHFQPVKKGYCYIKADRGEPRERAHRFIWHCVNGPIPDGKLILHTCDNRRCINPKHLFLGTEQDNTQDMMKKGRHKYISNKPYTLSDEQMKTVIQLREEGVAYQVIGDQFGVSATTIMNNLRRRS